MNAHRNSIAAGLALAALGATGAAQAHGLHAGAVGLGAGFLHPFSGADHIAVLLGVGVLAALAGGTGAWRIPAAFLAALLAGLLAVFAGMTVAGIEIGVTLTALAVVPAILFARAARVLPLAALAGLFALFHGAAHALAFTPATGGTAWVLGLVVASALQIATAYGLTRLSLARNERVTAPVASLVLSMFGVVTLLG